jgi:hypothetical protein
VDGRRAERARAARRKGRTLVRRQWLLEDMKDEAAVRASLSRLRRYAAPADAATVREVLLTLQLATDASGRDSPPPALTRSGRATPGWVRASHFG